MRVKVVFVALRSNTSKIADTANISDGAVIECDHFELGEHSYIGPNVTITCKEFVAGDYLWMPGNVDVGRGGCTGPNSIVHIGNSVGIFEGCVINPSEQVTIGNCVGIGADCLLWTHGAWLDPLEGFPFSFDNISIGNNVWLPARSIMLPGTNIGNNVVIGTASVITKDIPSGSLAMGQPCKVIKENEYPKFISDDERDKILSQIVKKWYEELLPHKDFEVTRCTWLVNRGEITLSYDNSAVVFDTHLKIQKGDGTILSEDFRDFLRRYGIRIYNGKPFRSIKAKYETYLESTS